MKNPFKFVGQNFCNRLITNICKTVRSILVNRTWRVNLWDEDNVSKVELFDALTSGKKTF